MQDKLESLTHSQLIQVINWTVNDLNNAANNYAGLDERVKGWCAMLAEAVEYQVDKAYNKNLRGEEQ